MKGTYKSITRNASGRTQEQFSQIRSGPPQPLLPALVCELRASYITYLVRWVWFWIGCLGRTSILADPLGTLTYSYRRDSGCNTLVSQARRFFIVHYGWSRVSIYGIRSTPRTSGRFSSSDSIWIVHLTALWRGTVKCTILMPMT